MTFRLKQFSVLSGSAILLFAFNNCGTGFEFSLGNNDLSSLAQKGNPFTCASRETQSVTPMKRLTQTEYSNSALAFLGKDIHTQLIADIASLSADQLTKSPADFVPAIADTQMSQYQRIAEKASALIKANANLASAVGTSCISDSPAPQTCQDDTIKKMGLLAFRRPLTSEEVNDIRTKVFALSTDPRESVGLVAYYMLMSPFFLMHVEVGDTADASTNATFNLTSYEIASRMSYMLWSAPPDQALYDLAKTDALKNDAIIKSQIDRMLEDPRAQDKVNDFFRYYLTPKKYSPTAYSAAFLDGLDVAAVNAEYDREMYEFINYIVWKKNGSFHDLLTDQTSFAKTPAVAAIYGHSPVTDNASPAMMSGRRAGLLMRGPALATEGNETHPILRGVKMNARVLCTTLGLPSGVLTNDPTFFSDTARTQSSVRTRTAGLTSSQSCMGCHSLINPYGFAFENFDGLGRARNQEKAFSVMGTFLGTHEIDTVVSYINMDSGAYTPAQDGYDIVEDIANGNQGPACFVKQMYRYYQIAQENSDGGCQLSDSYMKVKNGSIADTLKEFVGNAVIKKRRYQ